MATRLPPAVQSALDVLPSGLREHIQRVRVVARQLAQRHGVDAALADLGAAAHDLGRAMKGDVLLARAREYGLPVHLVEERKPLLLHGPVIAAWLERLPDAVAPEVIEAVRWHTTGHRGMGRVARVVFLADKLDPEKVREWPELERVRGLAQEDLDRALLAFLDLELAYFLRQGYLVHPESVELRNTLLAAGKAPEKGA